MAVSGPASNPHRDLKFGSVREITEVIEWTLVETGFVDLDVHWTWSPRFTARMGDACLNTNVLRFSRPLWPAAPPRERRETIVHEVCHLVAYAEFGRVADDYPHGAEWREVMSWAGYPNAQACHVVQRHGAVASVARAFCACAKHEVSLTKARRHVSGRSRLTCDRCKQPLLIATEDL